MTDPRAKDEDSRAKDEDPIPQTTRPKLKTKAEEL